MSHRNLGLVLVFGLVPVLPGAAHALDKVKSVHIELSPFASAPVIHVANDGESFTHVSAPVTVAAKVSAECKGANKIQDAYLVYGTPNIGGGWWEYSTDVYTGPEIPGGGGKSISTGASMNVPAELGALAGQGIPADPVTACNWALDAQVEQGQPRWQLLRDGFSTTSTRTVSFAARCQFDIADNQYVDWEYDSMAVQAMVECAGNPAVEPPQGPSGADDLAAIFQVVDATIGPASSPLERVCPTTVSLHGRIQVTGEGDVAFRIVDNGAQGPVSNLHFTDAQTVFEFDVETSVGLPGGAGSGGDLGSVVANPGGGGGDDVDDYLGVPTNVVHRTVSIETLAPHAKSWTPTQFTVICGDPKVNPGIQLPGGFAPRPTPWSEVPADRLGGLRTQPARDRVVAPGVGSLARPDRVRAQPPAQRAADSLRAAKRAPAQAALRTAPARRAKR